MAWGMTNASFDNILGSFISANVAAGGSAITTGDIVSITTSGDIYNAIKYTGGVIEELAGIAVTSGNTDDVIQVKIPS